MRSYQIAIMFTIITYPQIGRDPTDSPYQLTKRSHTGSGSKA